MVSSAAVPSIVCPASVPAYGPLVGQVMLTAACAGARCHFALAGGAFGPHTGPWLTASLRLLNGAAFAPRFATIVQIAGTPATRSETNAICFPSGENAICLPSGDHLGLISVSGSRVSRVSLPFASTT